MCTLQNDGYATNVYYNRHWSNFPAQLSYISMKKLCKTFVTKQTALKGHWVIAPDDYITPLTLVLIESKYK